MPGEFVNHSHWQTEFVICPDKCVLHKQIPTVCVRHHAFFEGVELVLRKIFVYVAPKNLILAAAFTHDSLILGGSAGVFTRVDKHGAVIGKDSFVTAGDL